MDDPYARQQSVEFLLGVVEMRSDSQAAVGAVVELEALGDQHVTRPIGAGEVDGDEAGAAVGRLGRVDGQAGLLRALDESLREPSILLAMRGRPTSRRMR